MLDPEECLDEIGLVLTSNIKPLQELFANILEYVVEDYQHMMVDWLGCVASEVPMIEKWLAVRGLMLLDYLQYLSSGGTSDGLELWAFSLAMNCALTVVSNSAISSTARDGANFAQMTLMLVTYTSGRLCKLTEEEQQEDALNHPCPQNENATDVLQKKGHPVIPVCLMPSSLMESSASVSSDSTDPENLMDFDGERTRCIPQSG